VEYVRKARAALKIKYLELAKEGEVGNADRTTLKLLSYCTLYRVLKRKGLTNYCYKKRPKLTCKHARKRYKFKKEY
jgi:hypothetical protein